MLIIIEGADCVGKTELTERLVARMTTWSSDRQPPRVIHKGPPTEHPLDEYVTPLLGYRPVSSQSVICDRWHIGESVYPKIFNRPTRQDPAVRFYIEMFLRARGALVVHITGDAKSIERCVASRGDHLVTPEQVSRLVESFDHEVSTCLLPRIVLSGYNPSDAQLDIIIERAFILEQTYAQLNQFVTYVGPRLPKLLLLGDVRGDWTGDQDDHRPAFMPYRSTSGHYLLTHVLAECTDLTVLRSIGIANACDVDDPYELHTNLLSPETVTLGRNACRRFESTRLMRNDTRVITRQSVHPQWQRRFKHGEGAGYARDVLGRFYTPHTTAVR